MGSHDAAVAAAGPMSGTYRRTRLGQFFGWSRVSWRSWPKGDAWFKIKSASEDSVLILNCESAEESVARCIDCGMR